MFYKYAVDPNCYVNWDTFQPLRGGFGWNKGRLIAEFPRKKWMKTVKNFLINNKGQLTPEQKRTIECELSKFSLHKHKFFIKTTYDDMDKEQEWSLENAIELSELFHAIITHESSKSHSSILVTSELVDNPLWEIDHMKDINLTPNELCKSVESILIASQRILFIDPYFKPWRNKWIETLERFISCATNKRTPILEYHLKIEDKDYIESDKGKEQFEQECNNNLKKLLPHGRRLTVFRWNVKDHCGELFHDRYVISEYGGVLFTVGLDSRGEGKTTRVVRLTENSRQKCWDSFQKESQLYEYVDKVEVIG